MRSLTDPSVFSDSTSAGGSVQAVIDSLGQSNLVAECTQCYNEFAISSAFLFDGTKSFPQPAKVVRKELQDGLDTRIAELQQRQVKADTGAEKKAIEVGIGKIIEKVIPAYKNFNFPLSDCRFLSEPIDVLVFSGASVMKIDHLSFMDIKTGMAKLNKHQRLVKDAVLDGRVTCEEF